MKSRPSIHNQEKTLPLSFFDRSTIMIAQELLGKVLVHHIRENTLRLIINEVEAYDGPHDKASHAHRGVTPRNQVMFGEAGHWYLYLVYGMHWMLNITTGPKDYPAAILIRGGYPSTGSGQVHSGGTLISGPGKITKYLGLNYFYNTLPALQKTGLWFEDCGITIPPKNMIKKKRIGVDYAEKWKDKLYNFSFLL
ncbi:MAG: DNA-3-methyladenine glycosylase [Parcubacteria group bacterium]|nr:DNA-3-methyladenine glycosylase [Parcubacteria group bacterium]